MSEPYHCHSCGTPVSDERFYVLRPFCPPCHKERFDELVEAVRYSRRFMNRDDHDVAFVDVVLKMAVPKEAEQ